MDKKITALDGSIEKQTESLKDFLGLKQSQSFQELDIDENMESD